MSRIRISPLAILAAVFMVSGLALLLASVHMGTAGREAASGAAATAVPTIASAALATTTPAASDPDAVRLFAQAQRAGRTQRYQGVKVVSRWQQGATSTEVVTVVHVPGRGALVTPGDAEGGSGATARPTPANATFAPDSESTGESATLAALERNYHLVVSGTSTVADRPVRVLEARRPDGSVAARFSIDDGTGLVLRRELVNAAGRPVESSAFVRIRFTLVTGSVASPSPAPSGWPVVDTAGVRSLRAAGWPMPSTLVGGLSLFAVHRQAPAAATASTSTQAGPVVQLSYTDGLTAVSVFLQHGRLDHGALGGYAGRVVDGGEVWIRSTGTPFVVWQARTGMTSGDGSATATSTPAGGRDIVVSATSDSPMAPLASVVAALPAAAPRADGVGDRVARGVERVTSWFDPTQ